VRALRAYYIDASGRNWYVEGVPKPYSGGRFTDFCFTLDRALAIQLNEHYQGRFKEYCRNRAFPKAALFE
jgi:hypothetical protein